MQDVNLVTVIVAVLGAGGLGAFAREIADVVSKVRNGVSAREGKRRTDIVAQRDAALARADAAERRADAERENRRLIANHAARLERQLILAGSEPHPWPDLDETTENPLT